MPAGVERRDAGKAGSLFFLLVFLLVCFQAEPQKVSVHAGFKRFRGPSLRNRIGGLLILN